MFEEHQMPDAVKIVVGNKTDLNERQVSKKDGELEATKYNSRYFEVSAKLGKRLDQLFNGIIDLICDNLENRGRLPAIEEEVKQNQKIAAKEEGKSKFQLKSALENAKHESERKQKRKQCC